MLIRIEPRPLRGSVSVKSGDWRAAAPWLAAGALGGVIRVENLPEGGEQPEAAVPELLARMGCVIDRRGDAVRSTHHPLCAPRDLDLSACPGLLPIMAAVACYARVATRIHLNSLKPERGKSCAYAQGDISGGRLGRMRLPIRELRVRDPGEGGRLQKLRDMLVGMGAIARAEDDRIHIRGLTLRGGVVDTEGGMEFVPAAVVAASYAGSDTYLTNAEKTLAAHADFFKNFRALGGKYTLEYGIPS